MLNSNPPSTKGFYPSNIDSQTGQSQQQRLVNQAYPRTVPLQTIVASNPRIGGGIRNSGGTKPGSSISDIWGSADGNRPPLTISRNPRDQIVEPQPMNPQEAYQQGLTDLNNGRFEPAVEKFNAVIAANHKLSEAMRLKSEALYFDNKFTSAAQSYQQMIESFPDLEDGYSGKGLSLAMTGSFAGLRNLFNRAIELNDLNWKSYFRKGYASIKMKNEPEAFEMLQKSITKNNLNNPISYVARAQIFCKRKNFQAARKDIQYANRAINQEQNYKVLYAFQVQAIKSSLQEYNRVVEKLKQAEELKKMPREQRQSLQTQLTKSLSRSLALNKKKVFDESVSKIEGILSNNSSNTSNPSLQAGTQNKINQGREEAVTCQWLRQSCLLI